MLCKVKKWDQIQQSICLVDAKRSFSLTKCILFQGACKKMDINIQGKVWWEIWVWPWGHLGALWVHEQGYSGQILLCWWGKGERIGAEVTSALDSCQLGEHGRRRVGRQMGLILLLLKKKSIHVGRMCIGVFSTCAAQQKRWTCPLAGKLHSFVNVLYE